MPIKLPAVSFKFPIMKIGLGLIVVMLGIGIGLGLWFYRQDPNPKNWINKLKDPAKLEQAEVKDLIEKVGEIAVLPQDEVPNVATVVDKETLSNQPFFALAQNGDKVLIYSQAQRAYIYRPSTHQMVNVGPLIIETN